MKRLTMGVMIVALATTAFAQANLPPGKWWRRPEIVQQLNLAEDQQTRLETIFRAAANDLIDLRGEVEKQNIALRGDLDQSQLDRASIRHDAQKLSEARAHLFERELTMLIDMRGVLNDSQWSRMRNELDKLGTQRSKNNDRPNARPQR